MRAGPAAGSAASGRTGPLGTKRGAAAVPAPRPSPGPKPLGHNPGTGHRGAPLARARRPAQGSSLRPSSTALHRAPRRPGLGRPLALGSSSERGLGCGERAARLRLPLPPPPRPVEALPGQERRPPPPPRPARLPA
ncbi:uncharacterized protein LOC107401153 isoform X1 [Peromyscus maniculatus bairdii]|uniref:uncharacterized protein LOC107401153 isoform X1 n=1 Tax=Peromyscus maniculatus bairdii TaxID=230844 RepID=UPI003FD43321